MKIFDILYTYYSCYGYVFTIFAGTFCACEFIGIQHKKNYLFYLFMNVIYLYFLFNTNVHLFWDNTFLKFFMSLVYGIGVVILYDVFLFPLFKSVKCFVKKYQCFCYLMCFFIIYLLLHIPDEVYIWTVPWYVLNYSFGIGSRFFIGTILHLFSPEFISARLAFWFCTAFYLVLAGVVSFCFDVLIKKSSSSCREVVIFLMLLYISSPFSITSFLNSYNFGRLEMYTLLLTMLSVIVFFNIKNNWIKYSLITVLTCVSTAIYQGHVFLSYPMLLITMIVSLLAMPKVSFKAFVGPVVNVIMTGISFIYFQFFSFVKFDNTQDVSAALKSMTDMPFYNETIDLELFRSLSYFYEKLMIPCLLEDHPRELLCLILLLLLPLAVLFYYIYKTAWISQKGVQWYKNEYLYCLLINLVVLPQFILNVDWGRWLIAVGTMVFFEIFLLVYLGNKGIIRTLSKMNYLVKKHYLLCLILIVYFAKLQVWGTTVETFYDSVKLYNMLF